MGNLFSTSRGAGGAASPVDLLPGLLEAIPMLSSILQSSGDGSGRLSSLLKGLDPQALAGLIQRFTGTMPDLEG
ncbi:MAG TPA: hypothetical protein PLM25_02325 [Limnochordia bacterium]|nr:hypothetical protein [Limnochordia bacterium]